MNKTQKELEDYNAMISHPQVDVPAVGRTFRYDSMTFVCSEIHVEYDDRYPDCATTLEVTARYKRRYEDGEID